MIILFVVMAVVVAGCATLPELYKTMDDIATDDAVTINIQVDKDAFKRDTDVHVNTQVDVINKEPVK